MAPHKRSNPSDIAKDRAAIVRSVIEDEVRKDRVMRSRAKARADAEAFRRTGQGTLREAFQYLHERNKERIADEKAPLPQYEGAEVIGSQTPVSPPEQKGAKVVGVRKKGNNTA